VKAPLESGLYFGKVRHRRFVPRPRTFTYSVVLAYLDLDELDAFFARRWLWSLERYNVVSFRRKDYLGPRERPLAECVRDQVETSLGFRPEGPVRMLTNLRCLGYVFNPVTFYWACGADGVPAAVVAEINNTPWNERYRYVLPTDARGAVPGASFAKRFHISPFQPMDQDYVWSFSPPGERVGVHMENRDRAGAVVFDATLSLARREATWGHCAWALLRHPLMGAGAHAAIYWQALRLKLRRTPVYRHPDSSRAASDETAASPSDRSETCHDEPSQAFAPDPASRVPASSDGVSRDGARQPEAPTDAVATGRDGPDGKGRSMVP